MIKPTKFSEVRKDFTNRSEPPASVNLYHIILCIYTGNEIGPASTHRSHIIAIVQAYIKSSPPKKSFEPKICYTTIKTVINSFEIIEQAAAARAGTIHIGIKQKCTLHSGMYLH